MRLKYGLLALSAAVAGCQHTPMDLPDRGVSPVNVPVVSRGDYTLDVATAGGSLPASEAARLDGWFRGLGLGYGDTVYVDGPYAYAARDDIQRIAGNYGILLSQGAPVTPSALADGQVRVIVSRTRVSVPNCPNWSTPSQPNYNNRTMSNFGCGVNTNLAAMVANPEDLIHGRAGDPAVDASTGAKAIEMYRNWPLTGIIDGQTKRPLTRVESTTGEDE